MISMPRMRIRSWSALRTALPRTPACSFKMASGPPSLAAARFKIDLSFCTIFFLASASAFAAIFACVSARFLAFFSSAVSGGGPPFLDGGIKSRSWPRLRERLPRRSEHQLQASIQSEFVVGPRDHDACMQCKTIPTVGRNVKKGHVQLRHCKSLKSPRVRGGLNRAK